MQIPLIIKALTGQFELTGLYSFEFVDKQRNTIVEIFFMIPPKKKDLTEITRSTTNPTLSSNYNTDAGNGTKQLNLSGELFFPYVGSPDNPVAKDSSVLENQIDGMTEFFKLQWMLMRYRDYTMTKNSKMTVPSTVMNSSPEITTLYKKVSKLVKNKVGALYDEVQLIFHDYDMDDHFYCRVDTFSSSQNDSRYIAVEYNISLELYERDNMQSAQTVEIKRSLNESVDVINTQLQNTNFALNFADIQVQISYNTSFYNFTINIQDLLEQIDTENISIQSGLTTPMDNLPSLLTDLLSNIDMAQKSVLSIFLTEAQFALYGTGDLTIDEVMDIELVSFYNSLTKLKIYAEGLLGVISSTVKKDEIRYYANADDYTLTTEQFDEDGSNKVLNDTTFQYYTVQDGDTARIIALRELKDAEKFITILKINSITESDFIEGNLIGQKIIIPVDVSALSRSEDNLVYEADDSDINAFLHGGDIALDDNGNMLISSNGDILGQTGIQVTYDSLMNRLDSKKGTLNVFTPNWGITSIGDGNAPLMVRIQRYITDLTNQIQSDPRVESVKIDMKSLRLQGEALSLKGTINFIGSDESREVEI